VDFIVVFVENDYKSSMNTTMKSTVYSNSNKQKSLNFSLRSTFNSKSKEHNESKVSALKEMITEIKTEGFDKVVNMIDERQRDKECLEEQIRLLEDKLTRAKKNEDCFSRRIQDLSIDNKKTRVGNDISQRIITSTNKEINVIETEVEDMMKQFFSKKTQSSLAENGIKQEQHLIEQLKKEIQDYQSLIEKEQENIKNTCNQIVIIKKQNINIKDKIMKDEKSSREFMNKVTLLVENTRRTKK